MTACKDRGATRSEWLDGPQLAGSGTTLRIALVIKLEAIEHCTVSAPHDLKSSSACQRSDVKCPEAYTVESYPFQQ